MDTGTGANDACEIAHSLSAHGPIDKENKGEITGSLKGELSF